MSHDYLFGFYISNQGMWWAGFTQKTFLWFSHSFWPSQHSSSSHPPSKTGGKHMDPSNGWGLLEIIRPQEEKIHMWRVTQIRSRQSLRTVWPLPRPCWQKRSVSGSASNFPSERGRRFSFCCERTFEPIFNYLLLFGESYYALPYLGGFLLNGLGGCKDVGESWVPWKPCLFNPA